MYHYTESGLRNVYLSNGYEEVETDYGVATRIINAEGLHTAIASQLIVQPFLSGREFRFLRVQMDMTQRQVGEYLGVGPQSVAMWEKAGRVPRKADQMIRALYRNIPTKEIAHVLDDVAPERFAQHFHLTRRNWRNRIAS
jgi:DNA-binding transcriptional regulator YiaG